MIVTRRSFLAGLAGVPFLHACGPVPVVALHDPLTQRPLTEPLPLRIGVVFDPAFATNASMVGAPFYPGRWSLPLGPLAVDLYRKCLPALFREAPEFPTREVAEADRSLDAVLVVEDVFVRAEENRPSRVTVTHGYSLYADGALVARWTAVAIRAPSFSEETDAKRWAGAASRATVGAVGRFMTTFGVEPPALAAWVASRGVKAPIGMPA